MVQSIFRETKVGETIKHLGISATRFEAHKLTQKLGKRLPSHRLLDDYLLGSKPPIQTEVKFPLWAREFLVLPARGRTFDKESHVGFITDPKTCFSIIWSDLTKLVPASELLSPNIGLFLDPRDIVEQRLPIKGNKVITPHSIEIRRFEIDGWGVADEKTRLPILSWEEKISASETRYLLIHFRPDLRILSLLRNSGHMSDHIDALAYEFNPSGVAIVENEEPRM